MNNKWLVPVLIGVIVVLLAVIAFGAYAYNQPSAYGPGWMMNNPAMLQMMNSRGGYGMMGARGAGGMMSGGFARGGFGAPTSLVAIAAQDLNVSATDLVTALAAGKSIADVAKEKNVATDKIVNNFLATHSAQMKSAVDAKWMTQAEADSMLALMKAHAQAEVARPGTQQAYGYGGMMRGGLGGRGGMMGRGWR